MRLFPIVSCKCLLYSEDTYLQTRTKKIFCIFLFACWDSILQYLCYAPVFVYCTPPRSSQQTLPKEIHAQSVCFIAQFCLIIRRSTTNPSSRHFNPTKDHLMEKNKWWLLDLYRYIAFLMLYQIPFEVLNNVYAYLYAPQHIYFYYNRSFEHLHVNRETHDKQIQYN